MPKGAGDMVQTYFNLIRLPSAMSGAMESSTKQEKHRSICP